MNTQIDTLTVDVTPDPETIWFPDEVVGGVWPVRQADGSVRMMPAQWCEDTMSLEIIPANRAGNLLTWAPQHAGLAPSLFQKAMSTGNRQLRRASVTSLLDNAAESLQARQRRVMQKVVEKNVTFNPLVVPAIMVFATLIADDDGGGGGMVMFAGNPRELKVRSGGLKKPTHRLLTPAWRDTPVADELALLAARANVAQADSVHCFRTAKVRQDAQRHWLQLIEEADAIAGDYLQTQLPPVLRGKVAYPPVAKPWMDDIFHIATQQQAGLLPKPAEIIGGCHKVMTL